MRYQVIFVASVALAVSLVTTTLHLIPQVQGSALDDYVFSPDPVYNYSYSGVTRSSKGWTAYMYVMTSQSWLTPDDSDKHIWQHQLAVIVPDILNKSLDSALIYITGGNNHANFDKDFPSETDEGLDIAATLAVNAKTVGAVLWQVPNQPITFPCDPINHPPKGRSEDDLVSLTFWHYMYVNNSDPTWLSYFPMTKAAVRALDTLTAVVPKHADVEKPPTKFIVAGASKRGWTTWLTGAVDKRVIGIMPIVLSALHLRDFAHRQFQFYGAWTFALKPYWELNFTQGIDLPAAHKMFNLIDPWFLRDRLTMPKMAINAVGDEFQMPDDQRYWAHDLPGEMNLVMLQNAEHSCATAVPEIIEAASSFTTAVQVGYTRPNYTWAIDDKTGTITVKTNIKPKSVQVWFAESPGNVSKGKRDFRWAAINATFLGKCKEVFGACVRPVLWFETVPNEVNYFTYTASVDTVPGHWMGFLIELKWSNPVGPTDFVFTSPVSVVPNTKPFPDCHGPTGCKGTLC